MSSQFIEVRTDQQSILVNVDDISYVEQNSDAIVLQMRTRDASGSRTRFVVRQDAQRIYEQIKTLGARE